MKTRTMRGARALIAMALLGTLGSCGSSNVQDAPAARAAAHAELAGGATAAAADSNGSLFEMTFPLIDQDGRTRHLSDLRGRPFVASMIYTNCTSVCPRVTADLQGLERALGEAERKRVRFVLFSLDPARDTPEALRGFAAKHHLDPARWTLMAASPDDMRTIAAVLDVRFRPEAGGEIAHTAMIAVVDRDGVVRHRQAGIQNDSSPLVTAVHAVR